LGLRKISYTPRARLAVGYRLEPHCNTFVRADAAPRVQVRGIRPLGNAMYLDRLLAGGIVGEALPLANLRIYCDRMNGLGNCVDLCG
jgi:hypothetical protein